MERIYAALPVKTFNIQICIILTYNKYIVNIILCGNAVKIKQCGINNRIRVFKASAVAAADNH